MLEKFRSSRFLVEPDLPALGFSVADVDRAGTDR
jgi:hypothetical protein